MLGFDPNGPQFQDAGAPADPGMPAPPMQQPQMPTPGQSGLTLGQANPQTPEPVTGPAANPYLQHYEQAMQAAQTMLAGARRNPLPDQGGPSGLAKFFNIGGAAGWDQYKQGYNIGVERYNKELDLHAATLARGMMEDQAKGDELDFTKRLRLLEAEMRAHGILRNDANDKIKKDLGETVPTPDTPQKADMLGAQGFGPTDVGGGTRWGKLQKQPGGGWSLGTPAATGSPADKVGLGPQASAPASAPSTPNPGESPADFTRRKAADAKKAATLSIPTGSSRTMAETAPKVLDAIQTIRDDLTKVKTGAVSSRIQSFGTALGLPNPAFKQYQVDVGLLRALFMRMHVGSRGAGNSALLEQYKGMIDAGKDSPQNMGASLDALEKYTNDIVKHGAQGIDASGSSAPNPSGAPTQATQPTSLDALLKKHGY